MKKIYTYEIPGEPLCFQNISPERFAEYEKKRDRWEGILQSQYHDQPIEHTVSIELYFYQREDKPLNALTDFALRACSTILYDNVYMVSEIKSKRIQVSENPTTLLKIKEYKSGKK